MVGKISGTGSFGKLLKGVPQPQARFSLNARGLTIATPVFRKLLRQLRSSDFSANFLVNLRIFLLILCAPGSVGERPFVAQFSPDLRINVCLLYLL